MGSLDRQILRLALPSIVSNITVPLLGLVDVAIVGHMGSAAYIGAISVGSMIFNVIYWVFGFLRMGTSGLTSQSLGRRDLTSVMQSLCRSVSVALAVAFLILLMQNPIRELALRIIGPDPEIRSLAVAYFNICVWGAPAMLTLSGLTGWYIGMQNTRIPMVVSIFQNVVNILTSLFLVYGCGLKVEGVALGTLIAQYAGVGMSVCLLMRYYSRLSKYFQKRDLFKTVKMLEFFKVNSDIFLRTLCLVAVNFYFLAAGSRQGTVVLAVNTLLMQLFILFSYFLDGFAFAGEALCGRQYGASNAVAFRKTLRRVMLWGWITAGTFVFIYLVEGEWFLRILTDDVHVVKAAAEFFPWAVAVPLVGVTAFVWDGVFIGITATKGMLVSSALATLVFFAVYLLNRNNMANHALWMAFVFYLAVRSLVQTAIFVKCYKK